MFPIHYNDTSSSKDRYYGNPGPVELSISLNGGGRNATAPYLYGW